MPSEPMSAERLEELRGLCEDAMPGPWGIQDFSRLDRTFDPYEGYNICSRNGDTVAGNYDYEEGGILHKADAIFIAAARTAIPELLTEIDRLRRERGEPLAEFEHSEPPTVIEIVRQYLVAHGYDGLYGDECGCLIDDLCPCGENFGGCRPGYEQPPPEDDEWDGCGIWVGPEKPGEQREEQP